MKALLAFDSLLGWGFFAFNTTSNYMYMQFRIFGGEFGRDMLRACP